jgi:hypothetical protein
LMISLGFFGLTSRQIAEVSRVARSDIDTDKRKMLGGVPLVLQYYCGRNSSGGADHLRKLLNATPSIRIIQIHSVARKDERHESGGCGGRLAEARKLSDLIRERNLVTYIGPPPVMLAFGSVMPPFGNTETPCAAACRVVFMGGFQRFMAPEAELGFRRGIFPGITDEEIAREDDEIAREDEAGRGGLLGAWVRSWFGNYPGDSMWWPTTDELRQAGVITGVASLNDLEVWSLRRGLSFRRPLAPTPIFPEPRVRNPSRTLAIEFATELGSTGRYGAGRRTFADRGKPGKPSRFGMS